MTAVFFHGVCALPHCLCLSCMSILHTVTLDALKLSSTALALNAVALCQIVVVEKPVMPRMSAVSCHFCSTFFERSMIHSHTSSGVLRFSCVLVLSSLNYHTSCLSPIPRSGVAPPSSSRCWLFIWTRRRPGWTLKLFDALPFHRRSSV